MHDLGPEPDLTDVDAAKLEHAARVTLQALEDLRDLTHGLLPSLLSTHGVETALRHSELVPEAHLSTGPAWQNRLPAALEGAVYRCCLDLLALHPASSAVPPWVHLDRQQTVGHLTGQDVIITVRLGTGSEGVPSIPQLVVDRVQALNGALGLQVPPDGGVVVTVRLPVPVPVSAQSQQSTEPSRIGRAVGGAGR